MFDSIPGNDQVKKQLQTLLRKGLVGNSYLFAGPAGVGKALFARAFAGELLRDPVRAAQGSHPDLHEYRPEGKVAMHSIDTLRQFSREVHMNPLEAEWKVFLLHDADRMLPTSANALLKTFEEPPAGSVILLLSSRPERLLPTILSRCQRVYFRPVEGKREIPPYVEPYLALLEGPEPSFLEIQRISTEIESVLEEKKKEFEGAARREFSLLEEKELPTAARETLEKEVAGAYSLRFYEEVDHLLEAILTSPKGREDLEKTLALIEEAKLKVERFMPIAHVLETLTYKLIHS